MELRQLATFIRVAQFKSFSRAAESLGYSQSAVTVQIRQLEEELDTRLFDRMGKRIALTDTGERFLSHACDVMNQVNQARMSVTSTAELHGSLHIGTIESLACLKLPTVLHLYRKFNPKVSIRITVGEPEDLIEHMERGELDMIYVLDEPLYSNNWNKLMEQREEIVFVASASLREELGVTAAPADLHECGLRRFRFEAEFHGKPFKDNQVSKVFCLWLDREAEDFAVQKSEIDYVKWFDLDEAVAAVEQGTIPNCIFPEELGMVKKFVGQTGGGC